jgi:UDP-3-O-[3-hydroxymyristoyl] glucosamine N-acyltransferase
MPGISLAELAERVDATLDGDGTVIIQRVSGLHNAGPHDITFLTNPRLRAQLAETRAGAVILSPSDAGATSLPKLVHANPYATYARVASVLYPVRRPAPGVAASAVIGEDATIDPSASIAPFVVVGRGARVGARVTIGAGTIIGDDVTIGDDVLMHSRVTVYAGCSVGPRTIVHAGAVIGADGFGMAEDGGRWIKIPQVGRVRIGADCEIGANTTIDRGALDDTVIEDDVKLDNQIQVGHNCHIGAHTAIAGCVGIAGSTIIGRNCKIGGAAMIAGHLSIPDGTVISAATFIFSTIDKPGVYTGTFPVLPHREWQYAASSIRRVHEMGRRVAALERRMPDDTPEHRDP